MTAPVGAALAPRPALYLLALLYALALVTPR